MPGTRTLSPGMVSDHRSDARLRAITAAGLVVGAALGMAGTFAPSASLRGLAWGLDGTSLVVAAAMLTIHHVRRGDALAAAGFLVFVAGVIPIAVYHRDRPCGGHVRGGR